MNKEELDKLFVVALLYANKAAATIDAGKKHSKYISYGKRINELKSKFDKQELCVLVAGEVSTGKSTFINALLKTELLETAYETCTNVPTRIKYGACESITVHFFDINGIKKTPENISREEIKEYSTEKNNKHNKKNVAYIEIEMPSPILEEGLVLVDSPGMGAIDPMHAIATLNIAKEADIIFFLGNTSKELTSLEIESLKNLKKCSNCDKIAHVLTCCDEGHPDVVLPKNTETVKAAIGELVECFAVSSHMYQEYLKSGDDMLLEESGFEDVLEYINSINSTVHEFLVYRYAQALLETVVKLKTDIDEIVETATDPRKTEERLREYHRLGERLEEIKKNKTSWQIDLKQKQTLLNVEIKSFLDNSKNSIVKHVEDMLKDDMYLNNTNSLSTNIEADLVAFRNDLDQKIKSGMLDIYQWLRNTTGLNEVEERIYLPDPSVKPIDIPAGFGEAPTSVKIRNYFGLTAGMAFLGGHAFGAILGTSTASAVLAKIGTIIGTTITPGVGTAIGAAIGGLVGFAVAKFQTKSQKRDKILAKCKESINTFFTSVCNAVSLCNIPNSGEIEKQFLDEINNHYEYCQGKKTELGTLAQNLRANWENIQTISSQVEFIYKKLTTK